MSSPVTRRHSRSFLKESNLVLVHPLYQLYTRMPLQTNAMLVPSPLTVGHPSRLLAGLPRAASKAAAGTTARPTANAALYPTPPLCADVVSVSCRLDCAATPRRGLPCIAGS